MSKASMRMTRPTAWSANKATIPMDIHCRRPERGCRESQAGTVEGRLSSVQDREARCGAVEAFHRSALARVVPTDCDERSNHGCQARGYDALFWTPDQERGSETCQSRISQREEALRREASLRRAGRI